MQTDIAQQMARSQEAWESRLKLAQEALKPQGAHGETRYRVSMQATLVSHCGECGSSLSGTRSQKRFEHTVWAANQWQAGDRATDLIVADHGPDYVGVTDVTVASGPVLTC